MSKVILALALLLTGLFSTGCATRHKPEKKTDIEHSGFFMPMNEESIGKVISSWPNASQAAAKSMMKKYGLPGIASSDMLIWYDTYPFKRTTVSRTEIKHVFPIPHSDVLQQTVDYRVPLDKVEDVSRLDGSLIVDRTKGELSARSDNEKLNYLALNLADKIVRGELTVAEARTEYLELARDYSIGNSNQLLSGLTFKTQGDTADPGQLSPYEKEAIQAQEENPNTVKKVEDIQTKK